MRNARMAAAMAAFALVVASAPASAQDLAQTPVGPTYGFPDIYVPPIVWNGNALDQKVLDAQAQMVPLRRQVRQLRHRHRG